MSGPIAIDHEARVQSMNAGAGLRRQIGCKLLSAIAGVVAASALAGLGGCETLDPPGKIVGDYLNLRNSFLDPSEVGRFGGNNPWGKVKPVKWPILDQLDVDDEPTNLFANATDPTPADLVPEMKEYTLAPGDTISVSVFELLSPGAEFAQQRRVNELGYVNLQTIGQVLVTGLTPSQLESKIAQTLIDKRILPQAGPDNPGPQVNVQVLESRQRLFSFLGSIRVGTYNIPSPDFRLLDAISLAGDIPAQPGMDYLYVIRQLPYTQKNEPETTTIGRSPAPAVRGTTTPATPNPLGTLEQIEKGTQTQPATEPHSTGDLPQLVAPLPTAAVVSNGRSLGTVAAGDSLDAALGLPGAATTSEPARAVIPATLPTAVPASPSGGAKVGSTNPADLKLLESAVAQPSPQQNPRFVFIDGRWVPIPAHPPTTNPAVAVNPTGAPVPTTNEISVAPPPEKLVQQRIIRIPIAPLRAGVSKYNIVVRPGDIINVPAIEPGEFYMMGNIGRPGVYALTGRKVTLKMAVAAAGNLGPQAIPRRCDLIRRIGNDQEVTMQLNLQRIFDGEQPDIFLKANDVVNIGTDALAPFLLITRNAYRASYGWGFTYDRQLYTGAGSYGNTQ